MCEELTKDDRKGLIEKQLEFVEENTRVIYGHRVIVKGWCITVLTAGFGYVFYQKCFEEKSWVIPLLILVLPVVLFWIVEGIYVGNALLFRKISKEIVQRLLCNNLTLNKKVFWSFRFEEFEKNYCEQWKAFWAGMTKVTVCIFYLILVGLSSFATWILYK